MENFTIILSFPASAVASGIYSALLQWLVLRSPWIPRYLLCPSCVIVALFVIEIISVLTFGALPVAHVSGPLFYPVHLALFFLTIPSLANIFHLQRKIPFLSNLGMTALVCGILGVFVCLLQYEVSAILFPYDSLGVP